MCGVRTSSNRDLVTEADRAIEEPNREILELCIVCMYAQSPSYRAAVTPCSYPGSATGTCNVGTLGYQESRTRTKLREFNGKTHGRTHSS